MWLQWRPSQILDEWGKKTTDKLFVKTWWGSESWLPLCAPGGKILRQILCFNGHKSLGGHYGSVFQHSGREGHGHLPRSVKSSEGNRSIKNFPRWWQATKYLEGNSSEFLSDRLVDVGASSCQAEDGRLPRLPCVPPPASHPHKPESHQESHSCARCKYIGPCMVPVIAAVYFCLPVIWKVKVRRQQLTYMFK